jgi:hypothetical protein
MEIYQGKRLEINGKKGYVRMIVETDKDKKNFHIVFKHDEGGTKIWSLPKDECTIKEEN